MHTWRYILLEGFCSWDIEENKPEDYYFKEGEDKTQYPAKHRSCKGEILPTCLGRKKRCPYLMHSNIMPDEFEYKQAVKGIFGPPWLIKLRELWETVVYYCWTRVKDFTLCMLKGDAICPKCGKKTYFTLNTHIPPDRRSEPGLFTFCNRNYCIVELEDIPENYGYNSPR